MGQKPVLGKGLASLFPGVVAPGAAAPTPTNSVNGGSRTADSGGAGATAAGPATAVTQIEASNRDRHPGISLAFLDEIEANPYQPRREFDEVAVQELAASIRENGIIQPLVVRKTSSGAYQLIAGERRLRAARLAGLKQAPVVIRKSTDREALELALVENIQRQDLNCIDEALAYYQLVEDFSLTQEEVAQKVGKDRATVANHLRLLRLPEAVIDDLKRGALSVGHGKALLSLEDADLRLRARAEIVRNHLSVREAEALVDQLRRSESGTGDLAANPAKPLTPAQARLQAISLDLTRAWSARVEVKGSEKRGKLVIHYGSRAELDRLLEAMQNQRL